MERKQFVIEEKDWKHLMEESVRARNTPVMAFSVADGLAGRDFASLAFNDVYDAWKALGVKYGFDGTDVEPVDEKRRIVSAYPVNKP